MDDDGRWEDNDFFSKEWIKIKDKNKEHLLIKYTNDDDDVDDVDETVDGWLNELSMLIIIQKHHHCKILSFFCSLEYHRVGICRLNIETVRLIKKIMSFDPNKNWTGRKTMTDEDEVSFFLSLISVSFVVHKDLIWKF